MKADIKGVYSESEEVLSDSQILEYLNDMEQNLEQNSKVFYCKECDKKVKENTYENNQVQVYLSPQRERKYRGKTLLTKPD